MKKIIFLLSATIVTLWSIDTTPSNPKAKITQHQPKKIAISSSNFDQNSRPESKTQQLDFSHSNNNDTHLNQADSNLKLQVGFNFKKAKTFFDLMQKNNPSSSLNEIKSMASKNIKYSFFGYESKDAMELSDRYFEYTYSYTEIEANLEIKSKIDLDKYISQKKELVNKIFGPIDAVDLIGDQASFDAKLTELFLLTLNNPNEMPTALQRIDDISTSNPDEAIRLLRLLRFVLPSNNSEIIPHQLITSAEY